MIFFALESYDDVSNESDDEGSGSGFTSGSCSFSFFSKYSVGRVSNSKSVGRVSISKSVGHLSSSKYVDQVSSSKPFCCVSGLFSVGLVS